MDFTKETNQAIDKVVKEKLSSLIEAKASAMVEDIVGDIFRWGDVRKQIKDKIEASINVNLQQFDLIDYNVLRLCDVWLMRKVYSATYCKTSVI